MAAGIISKPGSEHGPCLEACAHRDCYAWRAVAEKPCLFCESKIGYEKRFYIERLNSERFTESDFSHAVCAEKKK